MRARSHRFCASFVLVAIAAWPALASADLPTPGYPEPIVQWGVQKGETCEDIAKILYGSAAQVGLVLRYNRAPCAPGVALPEGLTLVLPATATTIPDAELRSMSPDVRIRAAGGGWSPAAAGAPLYTNHNVNTLDKGRADIEFIDRSRVFLAPNTLVVIYGTANRTRVTHTPPSVEIQAGEVKAGLSALRGEPVEIAVKGGGSVSAASREAVVERKGERTTVAVFDGNANVTSAGKSVLVPKNFGTRFVGVAPPIPPRPLPPAPAWEAGGSGVVVLAPRDQGVIEASWAAEPSAVSYRFEIARDEAFHDLIAREEVPATVRSFRAERLPPGRYYMSVRAIDKEDYLGIAARVRPVRVIAAELDAGKFFGTEIEANPYGVLGIARVTGLQMAIDQSAFGPTEAWIDFRLRAPAALRFRAEGSADEVTIPIRYTPVRAAVEPALEPGGQTIKVKVRFEGLSGVDIQGRVAPILRVHRPDKIELIALSASSGQEVTVSFPAPSDRDGWIRALGIDVIDSRGIVLGKGEILPPSKPAMPVREERREAPRIGTDIPLVDPSLVANFALRSPTARSAVGLGVVVGNVERDVAVSGQLRASAALDPVGFDASIGYSIAGDAPTDNAAWLGARWRALRIGDARFELGPALRFALPTTPTSAPARIEPAILVGGAALPFTWMGNLGARIRLEDDQGLSGAPAWETFALVGGSIDAASWLRVTAALDGYLFGGGLPLSGGGGLSAGLEGGTWIFGGIEARFSPVNQSGHVALSGQLYAGLRGP